MTVPGFIQLVLIVICSIWGYRVYFDRPKQIIINIFVAFMMIVAGTLMVSLNWFSPESLDEIWKFQAKDYYVGTILLSLGVGMIVGNLLGWLERVVRKLPE